MRVERRCLGEEHLLKRARVGSLRSQRASHFRWQLHTSWLSAIRLRTTNRHLTNLFVVEICILIFVYIFYYFIYLTVIFQPLLISIACVLAPPNGCSIK